VGVEDESQGMTGVAMVLFEEVGQWLAWLEGDQGQEDVAGERQIERGVGFAMTVPVFLPGAGVPFVVVAVFHRPVPTHRLARALLFAWGEAGEKVAGVAFARLERVFFLRPVALDREGTTGSRQPGVDGRNGGDGPSTQIQAPVFAFLAYFKKGVPLRACVAPARRLEVFSLVPTR
jgi:hypothetical protein